MQSLERLVDEKLKQFSGIEEIGKIQLFLAHIRDYHIPTYTHSMRVSLKCADAANVFQYNEKEMLYAGLLHDIGKLAVPKEILGKEHDFSEEDYKAMRIHLEYGYSLLANILPFTAEVVVRHHRYERKRKPYPEKLPMIKREMNLPVICAYAKLLSVIDFYDAMTTRHDNYPLEAHNARDALMAERKGMQELINRLFEAKILA